VTECGRKRGWKVSGWWEQGRRDFIAVHEMAREVWAEGMVVAVGGMVYFSE